jgi:RelE toxin of RelE / RelB toxin-antitoxin system
LAWLPHGGFRTEHALRGCLIYGNAVASTPMQTVVETPSYLANADRLFSPAERAAVVDRLAFDPACGVVVPGGGGIRKVRFGFGGRGKSGGARVVYLFSGTDLPVFILAVFAKNEKANLSQVELNKLCKLVTQMVNGYRRGR